MSKKIDEIEEEELNTMMNEHFVKVLEESDSFTTFKISLDKWRQLMVDEELERLHMLDGNVIEVLELKEYPKNDGDSYVVFVMPCNEIGTFSFGEAEDKSDEE